MKDIEDTYMQERPRGRAKGPYTYNVRATSLGGKTPAPIPISSKQGTGKMRTIQDGTAPGTNNKIRSRCCTRV